MKVNGLTRITKSAAKKRFMAGEIVHLCPVKMSPGGPFAMSCAIHPAEYMERYGAPDAWDRMYANWSHYNTSHECGNYASYWVEAA